MMPSLLESPVFAPFNEYPITRRYRDRRVAPGVLILTFLAFCGLAIFNILTQGTVQVSSSILLQDYLINSHSKSGNTTTCQAALLSVGESIFSTTPSNIPQNADIDSLPPSNATPGGFLWTVNSLTGADGNPDAMQIPYHGEELACNMSSFGVTFKYILDTFVYGVCAKCKARDAVVSSVDSSKNLTTVSLDLCTNLDLSGDSWPPFTNTVQGPLSAQIFLFSNIYTNMIFPPNTIPGQAFPRFYNDSNNPLKATAITPADIHAVNAYLSNFSYIPAAPDAPPRVCEPHKQCANGTYIIGDSLFTDTPEAFNATYVSGASGVVLSVAGIGNIQPLSALSTGNGDVDSLPGTLPDVMNYTFGITSYALDTAARDLDRRALAVTYLCTTSQGQWKPAITLLAVVFGNSLGLLGAILACLIFLARRYDQTKNGRTVDLIPYATPSSSYHPFPTAEPTSGGDQVPRHSRQSSAAYDSPTPTYHPTLQHYPSYGEFEGEKGRGGPAGPAARSPDV